MHHFEMPLWHALSHYVHQSHTPFHMPGHLLGREIPQGLKENLLRYDLTELPGLDQLHFPEDVILHSQNLVAKRVGAKETFYLVNGATVGILAALLSTLNPGDKIIVGRDCHRSVIHGLTLSGANPIFVRPQWMPSFGISATINIPNLESVIKENPDAKAVFLTRPSYYGICSHLEKIREMTRFHKMLLLLDEAHGAHFPYANALPKSAVQLGADLVVQSAHKTLPAPTQTGYLHLTGNRVDRHKLQQVLSMLQTTSPSYLLMVLLEYAGAYMEAEGQQSLLALIDWIAGFKNVMAKHTYIRFLSDSHVVDGNCDPTRITMNCRALGMSGHDFQQILQEKYCILAEMSDRENVVFIGTVSHKAEDFKHLEAAVLDVWKHRDKSKPTMLVPDFPEIPERGMSLKAVFYASSSWVQPLEAIGRIAKFALTPYPPGIPYVLPGEIYTKQMIQSLMHLQAMGAKIDGFDRLGRLPVVTEEVGACNKDCLFP